MKKDDRNQQRSTRIGYYTLALTFGWTCAIITSLVWNNYLKEQEIRGLALNVAQTYLENDHRFRRWNTLFGGIYLPLSNEDSQNVFLFDVPEPKITTPSGRILTLTDHGYMMRRVYSFADNENNIRGRVTSLDPLSPDNVADDWESSALKAFGVSDKEISAVMEVGGVEYTRLIRPFIIEENCLKCHSRQGYEVGDVRGGISVMVPMDMFSPAKEKHIIGIWVWHFAWWFFGMFVTIASFLGMQKRIVERQAADEKMAGLRLYLQNVIDSMPSILIGIDRECRVTQWNHEAVKITGCDAVDAIGCLLVDVFPMFEAQIFGIRQAMEKRVQKKVEGFVSYINGRRYYLDVIIYPLAADSVEGAVIRVDDVTDRVQMDKEYAQSEKMLTVAGLAEGVAHEINNPLGGIMQGAQNVVRRLSLDLPKNIETAEQCGVDLRKVRTYIEKRQIFGFLEGIRKSGKRVADIVNYMQQFNRCKDATISPVNLEELIERAIVLVASDLDLKEQLDFTLIEIVREYEPDFPKVFCSVSEIEQVLINLLKNAAQIMHESNVIDQRIFVRTRKEDGTVKIEIEDNGPGMDERTRKRIFEPFFTTKPPGRGIGLGLSVSYFIMAVAHKGLLSVESSPGKGAKFTISLPVNC